MRESEEFSNLVQILSQGGAAVKRALEEPAVGEDPELNQLVSPADPAG